MRLIETGLAGVLIFEAQPQSDSRGFFARTWDRAALTERGLDASIAQCSLSFNEIAGTLRGLHFQMEPYGEAKTIRCTAGAIFDVAVDLRPGSLTRHRWVGVELSSENRRSLYVPRGCGHGYLTLTDSSEVFYQISAEYRPDAARGYRWDDPTFGIQWPLEVRRISARDAALPLIAAP